MCWIAYRLSCAGEGEEQRFHTQKDWALRRTNRQLLWHGSRISNWAAIISQVSNQLRIGISTASAIFDWHPLPLISTCRHLYLLLPMHNFTYPPSFLVFSSRC